MSSLIYEQVLLSLGSNIGDKIKYINSAIEKITSANLIENVEISSYYESEPIGYRNQDFFINISLVGFTKYRATELFEALKDIEKKLGRKDRPRWHEREIDIDIIIFGQQIIESEKLNIPHPEMHKRKFVLIPAAEIAGDLIHPKFNMNIKTLLANCQDNSRVKKI